MGYFYMIIDHECKCYMLLESLEGLNSLKLCYHQFKMLKFLPFKEMLILICPVVYRHKFWCHIKPQFSISYRKFQEIICVF